MNADVEGIPSASECATRGHNKTLITNNMGTRMDRKYFLPVGSDCIKVRSSYPQDLRY